MTNDFMPQKTDCFAASMRRPPFWSRRQQLQRSLPAAGWRAIRRLILIILHHARIGQPPIGYLGIGGDGLDISACRLRPMPRTAATARAADFCRPAALHELIYEDFTILFPAKTGGGWRWMLTPSSGVWPAGYGRRFDIHDFPHFSALSYRARPRRCRARSI